MHSATHITPNAKENNSHQIISNLLSKKTYPFIKQISQFDHIADLTLAKPEDKHHDPDSKDSPNTKAQVGEVHTAHTISKKAKSGSSSEYSKSIWYEVKNPHIDEKCKARMNRMIVLTGELFRLLDGNQTKYRIVVDENKQYPISKGIKNAKDFFTFYFDNLQKNFVRLGHSFLYVGNDFPEGMGRGFVGKYFYMDNDFHESNAFVSDKKYFYVIDHDQCFWPFSRKLRKNGDLGDSNFIITTNDYNAYPHMCDDMPNHWLGNQQGAAYYFIRVASEPLFNNEKHFATIKLLVTQELQKFLVEYHLDDPDDKNELTEIINNRVTQFMLACVQSNQFKQYLNENRIEILQAIIFELHDFFQANTKYAEQALKWRIYINQIIECYSNILWATILKPLNETEKTNLIKYANNIFSVQVNEAEKADAFAQAETFYTSQKMCRFAEMARNKRMALQPELPRPTVSLN